MSDPFVLIGLSGPAGCGKTTVAKLLEERFGFTSMAFADPIRAACRELFQAWGPEHFERPYKESLCPEYGVSPRQAMRVIGEFARQMDPEIYAIHLRERLLHVTASCVVVHDVRFEAEAEMIRIMHLGRRQVVSRVVHIERPGIEWSGAHPSEVGVERGPEDLVLRNAGRLTDLEIAVDGLVSDIALAPWPTSRPA